MTWRDVARVMSERPAQIGRVEGHGRPLAVGEPANVTLVNPRLAWTVNASDMRSRSRNTPFAGIELPGSIAATILRGTVTYAHESLRGSLA
jgi:dihydroorotase